ncbi:SAM-dependent methyltransferase [Fictibacillus phosphorivorans]|uniref:SAM-dependent methyltransferase n=1 Tax=Fictibacillus phosphorivorans TaxID=1221500 RepID=A0A165P7C0_9BACL|nr:class I SAM-dependent methyltransferase [Fictibacillus phosphorivorans]KZE69223.1 SAM-dependent methyltransferase [Fictibacillus phosphorivorans]
MDTINQNGRAWDKKVENGADYTKCVSKEVIQKSKAGVWQITVTTEKSVPRKWFPSLLDGVKILCLASGGGQQAPILAAAGADVTVVDLSIKQLEQDKFVAKRDGLKLKTVQGTMTDLSCFEDGEFDLIVHPVSNLFIEDVKPLWKEAARVLKEGGVLIAGFVNPLLYIFDDEQERQGNLEVRHSVPSSSISHLTEEELQVFSQSSETIEFSHTLEDQIQGQLDAGFVLTGLYEDDFGGNRMLDSYINTFIATRAVKMRIE